MHPATMGRILHQKDVFDNKRAGIIRKCRGGTARADIALWNFHGTPRGILQVARQVFGAEPSAPEVLEFGWGSLRLLDQTSAAAAIAPAAARPPNPKHAARAAARALAERGTSTQAQEALRLQLEQLTALADCLE